MATQKRAETCSCEIYCNNYNINYLIEIAVRLYTLYIYILLFVQQHMAVSPENLRNGLRSTTKRRMGEKDLTFILNQQPLQYTRSVQKVSDLNFSRLNKSSTGSVHHSRCGGNIYAHACITKETTLKGIRVSDIQVSNCIFADQRSDNF